MKITKKIVDGFKYTIVAGKPNSFGCRWRLWENGGLMGRFHTKKAAMALLTK